MVAKCPRCDAEVRQGSRFCFHCGLDLTTATLNLPPPPQVASVSNIPLAMASGPPQPIYPYSRMAGYSVLGVLAPASPPKGSFWFGLILVLLGLVLTGCPLMLGIALGVGAGAGSSMVASLAMSGCFALLIVLPGLLLVASGRPRR